MPASVPPQIAVPQVRTRDSFYQNSYQFPMSNVGQTPKHLSKKGATSAAPASNRRMSIRKSVAPQAAPMLLAPSAPSTSSLKQQHVQLKNMGSSVQLVVEEYKRREERLFQELRNVKDENVRLRGEMETTERRNREQLVHTQLQLDQQVAQAKILDSQREHELDAIQSHISLQKQENALLRKQYEKELSVTRELNSNMAKQLEMLQVHPITLANMHLSKQEEEEVRKNHLEFTRHLAKMENAVKQRKTCYEEHLKEMRRWTAELDSEIASFSTSDAL